MQKFITKYSLRVASFLLLLLFLILFQLSATASSSIQIKNEETSLKNMGVSIQTEENSPKKGSLVCTTYDSMDVPKTISAIGSPSVSSTLNVPDAGTITDINVKNLTGTHTWINDLDFNLTSPSATAVQIMARSCGNQDDFDINLDDSGTGPAPAWPCPPTNGGTYQPSNALSAFNGEDPAGTWTLRVDDNLNQDGGSLNSWSLEICYTPVAFPIISVDPTSLSSTQASDTQIVKSFDIDNTGTADLNWTIDEDNAFAKSVLPLPEVWTDQPFTASMERFVQDRLPTENSQALAITPCVAGNAGSYLCNNVDLMAFLPLANIGGGDGSDIWGWTGCGGREFALMARSNGTAFVEITDPVNPAYLGNLPTHAGTNSWRDVKTYADHAFIVGDNVGSHGMQVFDLTQLCSVTSPPVTFSNSAHYAGFTSSHNIVINEDSGFAYSVGDNTCSGGLHMIDISTPTSPTFAGCFSSDGYTHDAQCVIYNGPDLEHIGKEICFNSNEDTVTIVDVTDKSSPIQLSRTGYANDEYTHQGWLTEDHTHFLFNDELDEQRQGHNTRTRILDVSNLDSPSLVAAVDGATTAIDHNLYIKGHTVYESNYRAGLRILDGSDVSNGNLPEIAFFDIYPSSNSASFNGNWSNYPYFDSDLVVASGIEQGLFVLRPNLSGIANDFTMQPDEVILEVCGTSDSTTLDFDAIYGFSSNVSLSVTGVPAGASSSFSVNPAPPNGSSVFTVTDSSASTGSYLLKVTGTGSGVTHDEYLKLNVNAAVQTFGLSAPTDSSTGVAQMPALSWTASTNADSYLVEIATDAAFTSIVYSDTITSTSHNVTTALDYSTTYYWRVTALNGCSQQVATAYSFTTESAPVCSAPDDIPWASLSSNAGTTAPSATSPISVTFDSTGMTTGTYTGTLCIGSNDTATPQVKLPLSLTVTCSVPTAPTFNTIAQSGTNNVDLTWSGGTGNSDVWRSSNEPYFTPGADCSTPGIYACTASATSPHSDNGATGDVANNYFYVIQNSNACGVAPSAGRKGEFDFAILPGTP